MGERERESERERETGRERDGEGERGIAAKRTVATSITITIAQNYYYILLLALKHWGPKFWGPSSRLYKGQAPTYFSGLGGALKGPSNLFMNTVPYQYPKVPSSFAT